MGSDNRIPCAGGCVPAEVGGARLLAADNLWPLCAGFFVANFFGIVWNTVAVSTRQRAVKRPLLGRVNALYRLFALGMIPFGLALSGAAVRLTEPTAVTPDAHPAETRVGG